MGMIESSRLLRELVALPSVNPAFAVGEGAHTGEGQVVGFLAATARRVGLEVEFHEVFPERPNLLVRLAPRGRMRRRILLAAHMDTVDGGPGQFRPQVKAGRLYGRGACDAKGSLAAMWAALAKVAQSAERPSATEIVFVGLVDEEHAQSGSRALARWGLKAGLAVVGEPTRLRVVTAHKGNLWLKLQTRGKSAHGARPELGHNAVHDMARAVVLLQTTYAKALLLRRHPLLGQPTISVGSIAGGTQPNIVPDSCLAFADRRTLPGETERSVCQELRALLRSHGLRVAIADSKTAPCLPLETDPGLAPVRVLMACAGQTAPAGVDFFCDAGVLAQAGVPSVVFGPGDIAQAHTANEWVSLRAVERATRILTRFLGGLP
jgi:acetylornithine deacetylase/succinyl-diaminopimelate desuccinylase-like protein